MGRPNSVCLNSLVQRIEKLPSKCLSNSYYLLLPLPLPLPLRSFKPKYRTVCQVLLQLVVASSWRISSSHREMNLTGFMPSPVFRMASPAFRMPSHY